MDRKLDVIDRQILALLLENGRISFAEIGRRVNLSLPAAAERVRRLEDEEIIEGYQAKINYKKLGYSILVFVELTMPPTAYRLVKQKIEQMPEIIEAYHVAGDISLILKIRLVTLEELEPIIEQLTPPGQSKSIVVLSTVVEKDGQMMIQ